MMYTLFLFILIFLNLALFHFFFRYIYPREGLISPIGIFLPFYQLIYPLRALILFFAIGTNFEAEVNLGRYDFTRWEVVWALAYATLFAWVLVIFYALLVEKSQRKRRKPVPALPAGSAGEATPDSPGTASPRAGRAGPFNRWQSLFFVMLVVVYLAVFYARMQSEGLFGLYSNSLEHIKRPFTVNLLYTIFSVEYFLLAFALLYYFRTRNVLMLLIVLCLSAAIIFRTIVSSSKGDLVEFVMILAICFWLYHRRVPVKLLVISFVVVIAFSFYSLTVRRVGNVTRAGKTDPIASLKHNIQSVYNSYQRDQDLWKKQVIMISNRLYGIDPIILCQRQRTFMPDGLYVAGSLADLGNLIPRILWPDRPHLSYNHSMSHEIWQRPPDVLVEMPIGKVGESYYVLNWAGFLYALLYAVLWRLIYVSFLQGARDEADYALYVSLLILYIFPDANLTYNWKLVLVILVLVVIFRQLRSVYDPDVMPRKGGQMRCPLDRMPPGFIQGVRS